MIIIELVYSFHLGSDKNKKNSSKANKKSLELDNKSKEVKEIINDLKPTLIKKIIIF